MPDLLTTLATTLLIVSLSILLTHQSYNNWRNSQPEAKQPVITTWELLITPLAVIALAIGLALIQPSLLTRIALAGLILLNLLQVALIIRTRSR